MKTQTLIFILSLTFLYSCDCIKTATGIVYDSKTKLPIANVEINGSNNAAGIKTNQKGEFHIMKMDNHRCGIIKTVFKLENYKTLKLKIINRSQNNIIYLEQK
jgi:hypothetical protein